MTVDLDSRCDFLGRSSALAGAQVPNPGVALRRAPWVSDRPLPVNIGRYSVLGQIAGGGMGSVFVAQMSGPAGFSRLVAIKCLHTRWLDDPKYVARFTTEVKLSTFIRHPNVVQALDVVEDGGELFLVMEYVDGVTLGALLADLNRCERPLPVHFGLSIMGAVLRGLHAAHQATDESGAPCRIVHRDVSPQNIMVSRNGHVMVLDFGAAKSAEHSQQTAAGVLVGKLAYMAPERVRGERSSPRSDVFSAGIVLWEALVGRRLFHDPERSRGELLHALVLKSVKRPSQFRAEVPRRVDDVVRRALERNPERRFQTALDFAQALEAAGAGVTGAALGELVGEVCAERLSEKEALLRSGLRAAAVEPLAQTPTPPALAVPPPQSFPGFALEPAPRASRASPTAWLGAAVLVGAVGWWAVDTLRYGDSSEPAARPHARTVAPNSPMPSTREGDAPSAAPLTAAPPLAATAIAPASNPAPVVIELPALRMEPLREPRATSGRPRRADASVSRPALSRIPDRRSLPLDCDPPTYMDAAGIRHFKKVCL